MMLMVLPLTPVIHGCIYLVFVVSIKGSPWSKRLCLKRANKLKI